ncbi:hypothetical protein PQ469_23985 [Mucilaginibacter sp. KACC 22773]|uniref:hypothetical protein n=1 Tax=Mucilaginibacter sp. KACC 22773 TaxID=3025671 RepID=UPI00236686BB|nr:hypothetical protein [Mucilaginibacter sp. KACC 22773]WDF76948.1 hypothetical protein PQ469_23985 [Mucilaginibacter sp. KACC 22773]
MSQLNFFITRDETISILNALIDTCEVDVFIGGAFEQEKPAPVSKITTLIDADYFTLWLKNEFREPKGFKLNHGDNKDRFIFDYYKDPIMQFADCKRTPALISPGRIFYKAGWVEHDELRQKHKNWGIRVSRLIDKRLHKLNSIWRISDDVKDWVVNGGNLELGPGGMIINKYNLTTRP